MFRMATEATARAFFSQPYFAVVGASNDPAKFGHKSRYNLFPQLLLELTPFLSIRMVYTSFSSSNTYQSYLAIDNRLLDSTHGIDLNLSTTTPCRNSRLDHHAS